MTTLKRFLYSVGVVLFLTRVLVLAQDPTSSETIRVQQGWDRFRIEQQIQQATAPLPGVSVVSPQLPPPDLEGKSQEKIFKLNRVIFEPVPRSVPLEELEAVAARYTAMEQVSIYDLYSMVVEIDALFDKRQVLGRAGLPIQDVENGIVTVQIVEGRENMRTVTTKAPRLFDLGGDTLVPAYRLFGKHFVDRQFRFSGRSSFNVRRLEDEILRYNRTFRSQIVAEIEPGDDLGDCTLKLTRVLPKPVSGGYYVDNSGRETSGRIRQGVYVNLSDVLGMNDSFFVSYDKTEGTSALYAQGEIPVNRFGTFFDISYYYGEPKTTSGPFAVLGINGISEQFRPGIRQILINEEKHRLDVTLHYQSYDSQTFFDTALNYAEKHDAWTIGLEYSRREDKSAVFAGVSFVGGRVKTLAIPVPDYVSDDFGLLKMNLMKVWYPSDKCTFVLRGNGSLALTDIPQSQAFQIGGMATVRGTPEALLNDDSGYLFVAEVRRVIWSGNGGQVGTAAKRDNLISSLREDWKLHSKAEIFTFFDHGGVFDRDSSHNEFLYTVGAGATVHLGRHCSLSGGYGLPIFTEEASEIYRDELRDGNAFFTASVSF